MIKPLSDRKMVLIGDSYGTGHGISTGWCDRLLPFLGDGSVSNAYGGAGFANTNNSFYTLINNVNVDDKNTITDVVCIGGWNDNSYDLSTIRQSVEDFCQYAKSEFPNAIVHIGCIGWDCNTDTSRQIANAVWTGYRRGAQDGGAHYISGLEGYLHSYDKFADDGYHPNASGQEWILGGIMEGLMYGNPVYETDDLSVQFKVRDGSKFSNNTVNVYELARNGSVRLSSSGWTINYSSPVNISGSTRTIILGSKNNVGICNAANSTSYSTFTVAVSVNGGSEETMLLCYTKGSFDTITNGNMFSIFSYRNLTNVSSLTIRPWVIYLPLGVC